MKTTKKILALVMAVAMLFSLCMFSASAYDIDGYVNVEIQIYDDYAWDIDLDYATIAAWIGNDAEPPTAEQLEDPNYVPNVSDEHVYYVKTGATYNHSSLTVTDAILAAYLEMYGEYDEDQVHYNWYYNENPVTHGYSWGVYIDTFEGLTDDSYTASGTYYFMGTVQDGGVTKYQYYWVGDGWNLTINGAETMLYSSEYELDEEYSEFDNAQPQTIVLNYTTLQSDPFLTNQPIPGASPAPQQ